jgi:putative acetyltransferase
MSLSIRAATPADAEPILHLHRAAILAAAPGLYDADVIADWASPITDAVLNDYTRHLTKKVETTLVAERDGQLLGFAALASTTNEVRAVYVAPRAQGQGVGMALLHALEEVARRLDLNVLTVEATRMAEAFYARHGYQRLGAGTKTLHTGLEMPCVHMRKWLA